MMKRIFLIVLYLLILKAPLLSAIIKVGDVLDIKVMSNTEFSGRYTVSENGTIDYPLLADQKVINISTSELMNELTFQLARHIDNPLVLISVVEKPEIKVSVLGQVAHPGPVDTYQGATLQEVIMSAGGFIEFISDLSRIKIVHHNRPQAPESYDLAKFLLDGSVENMPVLENGDVVIVLSQEHTKKVKVIGSVQKPGLFDLEEKMNLFEIIYLAGGPSEKADLSKVRRFSQLENIKGTEEVFDVQSYIDKGQMDNMPLVNEGDVIIVYSKWYDWKTILTVLNNTLLFIITIQTFAQLLK